MSDGTIEYVIRLRGGPAAASEAAVVRKALEGVGNANVTVAKSASLGAKEGNSFSTSLYNISRMARLAGYALSFATAAGGAFIGLRFDSTMEQNNVAFTHFLGNTQAATDYLGKLYELAAKTPFEFLPLASAAKQMLAFGFSAKGALDTLTSIGDAVSGLGTGQEGINRIVLAFGQIKSAGVIQGDELRQLQEAGINAYKYLAAAGLIRPGDRANIGKMYIDADAGLRAIVKGMNADFGGLAKEQAKTFAGQLSTMKDYVSQFLGVASLPLFNKLKDDIFPAINSELTVLTKMVKEGAGAGELLHELDRWVGANGALEASLRTVWHALTSVFLFIRDVAWPAVRPFAVVALASLIIALQLTAQSLDLVRNAIGPLMPLVQVFVAYRLTMWIQGLSLVSSLTRVLAMDMGALRVAMLGVGVGNPIIAGLVAIAALLVVVAMNWEQFKSGAVNVADAIGAAFMSVVNAIKAAINFLLGAWNSLHFRVPGFHIGPAHFGGFNLGLPQVPLLAEGGTIRAGGAAIVGDNGPEILDLPAGAQVTPLGRGFGGGDIVLKVGGRELARVLRSELLEAQARGA